MKTFGLLGMLADDRDVLSWSGIVARNPVVGLDIETSGEFVGAGEMVGSAHEKEVNEGLGNHTTQAAAPRIPSQLRTYQHY
jgi:hypothetical protein